MKFNGIVASTARMVRSFPPITTTLEPASAIETEPKGRTPRLLGVAPPAANTSVRCPSDTYSRVPIAFTLVARVTEVTGAPCRGDDGVSIEKVSMV